MDRETAQCISAAVDAFAEGMTRAGRDAIFQCSASTDDPEAPVLSFWGNGEGTALRLDSFEVLLEAVIVHMARAAKWKKEEVAREAARIALNAYRLTFTPGEEASEEERAAIESEGAALIRAALESPE